MFKKPHTSKTSAPLRNSDRRKLRQRVLETFPRLTPEDGDLLVPEGILSTKYTTHLDETGTLYMDKQGDPIWFTLGRSEDLIPTVYTLWKQPSFLPFVSTPSAVIPILVGGSDLMLPGVVEFSPEDVAADQLIMITQYSRQAAPPLGIGRTLVDLKSVPDDAKGKAVKVLHIWKDHLWLSGSKKDPPPSDEASEPVTETVEPEIVEPTQAPLDNAQVSVILRRALLQSISTSTINFPVNASNFYDHHVLPSRPAYPPQVTPIDIKHSSHKSLTAMLKVAEKEGLLRTKDTKPDGLVVTSVNKSHADVLGHTSFTTVGDVQSKAAKREAREEEEARAVEQKSAQRVIQELYKPHVASLPFFAKCPDIEQSALLSAAQVKTAVNAYITAHDLVNKNDQAYINIDSTLEQVLSGKSEQRLEFLKRDQVIAGIIEKMQAWYSITTNGKDPVLKKGALKPISVITKMRQGRKACTLVTGFEAFELLDQDLADELRKLCASATSIAPIQPKGTEVLVQGMQIKIVEDLLQSKGVPKKYIKSENLTSRKK